MSEWSDIRGRGCARYGRCIDGDGYHHGESLECRGCGTVYVAVADDRAILTEDDARCVSCRAVMAPWPQPVRFEMIETAAEATSAMDPPGRPRIGSRR